jgi:ketosteroid isomerase-like protein
MKSLLFSLLFLLASAAFAQKQIMPDKTMIMRVLSNQQKAWNDGRIEDFMNGYWQSDSLVFIGKKGITKGWQQTLDNYKKSYPDKVSMGELEFTIIAVELLSKTSAHVVGKWHLKRELSKGDLEGHFTLLFKKMNKRWVIVSDHSS